ncbi:MAG TPA: hypothetical protein VIK72_10865 [Clostridiaceae bacterium]
MLIYISEELVTIRDELLVKGYKLLESEKEEYCDVIILNIKETMLKTTGLNNIKRDGTIFIDSGSKSIEDIEGIMNNRGYSNIL